MCNINPISQHFFYLFANILFPALYKVVWHQKPSKKEIRKLDFIRFKTLHAKRGQKQTSSRLGENTVDLNTELKACRLWNAFSGPTQFKSTLFISQLHFYKVDFWLHKVSAPLITVLFKGQMYLLSIILLRLVVLTLWFCPQVILGNVWRQFWSSQLGGGVCVRARATGI